MRKTIERPKEAITKVKTGKLDMKDVFIIFAAWGFGYLTKIFVAPIIEIGYVIAYPISMYLLLSPSNVPAKKKYSSGHSIIFKGQNDLPFNPSSKGART